MVRVRNNFMASWAFMDSLKELKISKCVIKFVPVPDVVAGEVEKIYGVRSPVERTRV